MVGLHDPEGLFQQKWFCDSGSPCSSWGQIWQLLKCLCGTWGPPVPRAGSAVSVPVAAARQDQPCLCSVLARVPLMDEQQEGAIGLVLAALIPAYILRQGCIGLYSLTGTCLHKNVILKAFWIDRLIIYYCSEELAVCRWQVEFWSVRVLVFIPYNSVPCTGNGLLARRDLGVSTAELGQKDVQLAVYC